MSHAAKLEVALLSDEDVPTCFQILSKAFGHDAPMIDIYYMNHDTPSGQAQGSKRLAAWKQGAVDSSFLKAVMKATEGPDKIIGVAIWTYMQEPPPSDIAQVENAEEAWPDEGDREYITRLWRSYIIPRTQAIKDSAGKGVYVLELLAVHPDYQRLGAGTALVNWGTTIADERGLQAAVEGTPVGRHLYEQCGLQAEIEEMRFDVGEDFADRRKPKLIFLTRSPVV